MSAPLPSALSPGGAAAPAGEIKTFHLHLVSDATGETVIAVARACMAQFDAVRPIEHFWNLVRTERQLNFALEGIKDHPGVVLFTLVDANLRQRLQDRCRELGVLAIPILDPAFSALASYLGREGRAQPGRQHTLDHTYFQRIEAMDFAIASDDGQGHWKLTEADVILVGVSRTSKTPTCIYLANRGIKAANVPFVPGVPLPDMLLTLRNRLVVGLTEDPQRLVQIRRNRLKLLNKEDETSYTELDAVIDEVRAARRLYTQMRWPVIDVTRRSIEETAAEIIRLLNEHRNLPRDLPPPRTS